MLKTQTWKRIAMNSIIAGAITFTATTASAQTITVQTGDSLYLLAKKYQLTIDHLKIANRLTTDAINAGTTLYIPPKSSIYTIQSGDSLWKIAQKFGTTITKLKELNPYTTDYILTGDKLLVPIGQATTYANTQAAPAKPWVEIIRYTVQPSDTSWTIAIKFGIPMSEFLQTNNFTESTVLYDGQVVKVPVHHIPLTRTPGPQFGEYVNWFQAAQYLFPINAVATVTDFKTGKRFKVKRTIGASHSDTEPLTAADAAIIKEIWGGSYSWSVRPIIVETNGRRLAASMSSMPHGIEYITNNNYAGHFDIHFPGSLRHKDNLTDSNHQAAVRVAAGR